MFESTAVWSEEQVFPNDDDRLAYLDVWTRTRASRSPASTPARRPARLRRGVWNHWLHLGADGPEVVLDAWESSRKTDPKAFAVAAYNRAIRRNGGHGFAGVRPLRGGHGRVAGPRRQLPWRGREPAGRGPVPGRQAQGKAASGQQGEPVQPRPHGVQAPSSQAGRGRRPGAAGGDSARRANGDRPRPARAVR